VAGMPKTIKECACVVPAIAKGDIKIAFIFCEV
jgi:hypothetical protein